MKSSQEFKKAIQEYLEQRAKEDGLFAVSYAKANKSIDECCNYILSTVHKSGCNGFMDAEIYGMAVHYYDEDNIKDVKPVNACGSESYVGTCSGSITTEERTGKEEKNIKERTGRFTSNVIVLTYETED